MGYTADRHDEPRLRTPAAYSVTYDKLYNALPDCRDCGCVSASEFIFLLNSVRAAALTPRRGFGRDGRRRTCGLYRSPLSLRTAAKGLSMRQ